ncbi:hypothetical protein H5T51_01470 [Candidatus Bathyarchaeota archaeon]|nr:hypothetical protein [Candidatus Bathyarchaeota archaeon]
MLGFYPGFPEYPHKIIQLKNMASIKRLQQRIINTLYELNCRQTGIDWSLEPSVSEFTVTFEFGIAEDRNFNYLDMDEAEKALKAIDGKPFKVLDFFCAICYYRMKKGESKPLKFDYYMLRMLFDKKMLEVRIFHERGPRRISPEELASFIIRKVNENLPRKILKPI